MEMWCTDPCKALQSAWLATCAMASCKTPSLPQSACTRKESPSAILSKAVMLYQLHQEYSRKASLKLKPWRCNASHRALPAW